MRTAYALRWWLAAWMMFQALPLWAQEPRAEQRAALQQRLDAKLAELEAVQREVEQLQRELNLQPQLLVHVAMYEVNMTKLRSLGIDWAQATNPAGQNPDQLFKQPGLMQSLVEKNIARLIADPSVVTVMGRPATFHEGGETPVGKTPDGQLKYEPFGTQLDVLGTLAGIDQIDLHLKVRESQLDHANSIEIDGKKYPGLRVRAFDTSVKLKSGDSFVLQGPLEERIETNVYTGGRKESRINKIQSVIVVTAELMDGPLGGFSTVSVNGQQPPQPGTGYGPGGVQTTLVAPQPTTLQYAIEVQVQMMELSLTKLRSLGHDVHDTNYWIKAFGLEELHAANPIVDGHSDVVLVPPSKEHGLTIEQHVGPLMESGAIKIVGRPTAITRSGQDVLMELASDSLNYRLALTPTLLDAKQHSMELDLKFSLSEPLPGSSAQKLADSKAFVVSTTERKLRGLYAAVIFPGPTFRRNHLEVIGDRKQESVEEIVPVYVVLAGRKLVPTTPPEPHDTAAKPAIRR